MTSPRLLYLIKHTNDLMFKIGIATDNSRFSQLHKIYHINWSSSFYFIGENQDITKLEKILHKLFFKFNMGIDKQNGYTEWFSIDCLDSVIEAIKFNVNNSNYIINLDACNIDLSFEKDKSIDLIKTSNSWIETKQTILNKYPVKIIDKWLQLDRLEPTHEIIDSMNNLIPEFYCVLKPSPQISCIYEKNNKIISLEPFQFDAMNYFCYKAREQILKKYTKDDIINKVENDEELFNFLRSQKIEIDLDELAKFTEKYNNGSHNRKNMFDTIRVLEDIKVTVGIFKTGDLMVEDRFSLLSRTRKITNSKMLSVWLEPELTLGWLFGEKPFTKLHLKIQTRLKNTYSKILYEICKDYMNLGTLTKSLDLWKQVLHLNAPNVSQLKGNYLNRAIKEINDCTDIKITRLFGTKTNGVTSLTVEFEKQPQSRLEELGLIAPSIIDNKFYNKSKTKLDKLVKGGYQVIDEEMWIETDIRKNEDKYDAEIEIDEWLKDTDPNLRNDFFMKVAHHIDDCSDPSVMIVDYRIVGCFSNEIFTKNPLETMTLLNEVIDK